MLNQISNLVGHYEAGQLSRRDLILGIAALAAAPRASAQSSPSFKGAEMNHVAINVPDVQRSRDFYQGLLDLPILQESPNNCFLRLGEGNFLTLFRGEPGLSHFCVGIENFEVGEVTEELKRLGLNPRQPEGTDRVYFHDPDGIEVQLSQVGMLEFPA